MEKYGIAKIHICPTKTNEINKYGTNMENKNVEKYERNMEKYEIAKIHIFPTKTNEIKKYETHMEKYGQICACAVVFSS